MPSGRAVRATAALALVPVLALGVPAPSGAHVQITPSTTAAGATTVLELTVPHGCEGSPTTQLSVQVPTGVLGVVPTRSGLWEVETEVADFTQPVVDAHGNEITERVTSVTWTAEEPLPDGVGDTLAMSMQLPEEEGTQLWFPVVQRCQQGEAAWIEVAEDGQDPSDLELPAPTFTVGAAAEEGHGHGSEPAGDTADTADAAEEADGGTTAPAAGTPVLGIAGLLLGLLGTVLGGTALLRQRRGG